ncbi:MULTISPECIES: biotin/lipoate A/B protein ligase family protein [Limnochorda]|uniref:lipoate--protein ligase family protein n=1 Tax=Limnochorda TaxID=1676651 RepID=UPI0026EFDEA0|nr:biotin/lipoate A/B protein ligase family protein [Limnochorda pilosa]
MRSAPQALPQETGMEGLRVRLLPPMTGSPAWNMAVDEALLRTVGQGRARPTLRFYRWQPPALSVGRFQSLGGQVRLEILQAEGIGLVRRPTGGRAVLHGDEVTYAVILPEAVGLPRSVTAAYRILSRGLAEGLRLLGITPEFLQPTAKPASSGAGASSLCFEAPSWYELAAQGKKLVGSAQLRRFGGLLQHGSLPLRIDRAQVARLVAGTHQGVLQAATSLEEVLGRPVPFEEGAAALQEGFARALGWRLEPGNLTGEEAQLARRLEVAKYATPAWTWDGMEPAEEEAAGHG